MLILDISARPVAQPMQATAFSSLDAFLKHMQAFLLLLARTMKKLIALQSFSRLIIQAPHDFLTDTQYTPLQR